MPKKAKIKINMIILACFFLGVVLSIQLQSTKPFALVSLSSVREIQRQVHLEKEELDIMKKLVEERQEELNKYSSLTIGEVVQTIEHSLDSKKAYAGVNSLDGEGIILRISDSKRDLNKDEDPNNLIVHDQDILNLVNDLKIGGAEAISINGERLMANTEIKCSGATITINNKTYGQPFVITAIGNSEQLTSSITAPDSYGYLLTQIYGIDIEVINNKNVKVPAFSGDIEYIYRKDDVK